MTLPDVRTLGAERRQAAADHIRTLRDFNLPRLEWFNDQPCPAHTSLEEGQAQYPPCRRCGIRFRKHQRVGIAWLYTKGKGLLADQMGTGKTAQAAGLIAALKQNGELDGETGGGPDGRVIVICRPAALAQWVEQLQRFLPKLVTVHAAGRAGDRHPRYHQPFDILAIGHQMFLRDNELLDHLRVALLVVDDVDELRSPATATAVAIKYLARRAERVMVATGTALQKRLNELHSICDPLGGHAVFGSASRFRHDYCREELCRVYNPHIGRYVLMRKTTGYRNLDEFVGKLAPFVLRRTPAHIDDVELPVISPHNVFLDLHARQRERYTALRKGVLQLLSQTGVKIKAPQAAEQFLYGQKICAGLNTLGETDGPGMSAKLDWVEQSIVDGDLSEEKVVVFCHFTDTAEALLRRLGSAGVGAVVIWGRDTNKQRRADAVNRFWDDPACRVLVGTDAIEQSLNLQVSRHLINVDQLMNAARMAQLAGRIRRDGSPFRTVYVHNLLTRDTQEEGYLDVLAKEQALADFVWGEQGQLYEKLSPLALLQLIGKTRRIL
jgi:SNF2 family DNA or RNA helicase